MFRAITKTEKILRCQKEFEKDVKKLLSYIGLRRVGFPGGHEDCDIWANDTIWYYTSEVQTGSQRFWNGFGLAHDLDKSRTRNLHIAVEINIPFQLNRRVSGLYAKDMNSKKVCLFHRGRLAGGRKGIGKKAFLEWYPKDTIDVIEDDQVIEALLVTNLQDESFIDDLSKFVEQVSEFRHFITGR